MAGSGENVVIYLERLARKPGAPAPNLWRDTAALSSSSDREQSNLEDTNMPRSQFAAASVISIGDQKHGLCSA